MVKHFDGISISLFSLSLSLSLTKHSHEKRKETRAVYIEMSLVSWNLLNCPKHRGSILRNIASSEVDEPLAKAFHAIMDKKEPDLLHTSRIIFQKDSSCNCQFCTKVRETSRLVSEVWAKIKACSSQNIEPSCKNKLKLAKLKDFRLNGSEKLAKERWMYVNSNWKTLKFQRRDIISDYEFLLSILNIFAVGTEEYYPKCYNVNDAQGLQILYHDCSIILHLNAANHTY